MSNQENPFGDVIFSYTRADAIRDGVLVDLSQGTMGFLCRRAGFRFPVAMTATAFQETVGVGPHPAGQNAARRLWEVLRSLRVAISKAVPGEKTDRVYFTVSVDHGEMAAKGEPARTYHVRRTVDLWALIGPGDQGEPVLTVMLPTED